MELIFFYLVALVAVLAGFLVVKCQSPVNSAISLVMTFFCLAIFYVMLNAPFMAAIQIMVYAGAIMVLIIFTIMLLNLGAEARKRYTHGVVWSAIASGIILCQVVYFLDGKVMTTKGDITSAMVNEIGHTEMIGRALFTEFLLPFEITSILLLVAIVGAVVISKKKV